MGGLCEHCGMDLLKFPMCADFDHIDPAQKSFTIGGSRGRTFEQLVGEVVAKTQLLCANCHRIKTAKY